MTMASTLPAQHRTARWLLLASLTLNLFFVGTIGALAIRHFVNLPQQGAAERPRTAAARIERLAAALPAADAEKLRAAFHAREVETEGARDKLNRAIEGIQGALRARPFDVAPLRAAMAEARTTRPLYDETMQDILLAAAVAMSQEGRDRLADWPGSRPAANGR